MGTHTPKPWVASDEVVLAPLPDGEFTEIADCAGFSDGQANAARIVKCVNGWDEQQAKIDELVKALEAILDAPIIYTGAIEEPMRSCGMGGIIDGLLKSTEAALTRAKSGE